MAQRQKNSAVRRLIRGILLAAGALALGIGATFAPLGIVQAHADTSDFSYTSWHVSYDVGVDENGRAVAHVTETLNALFPDFDQNRGIVRGLPVDYEGASTDPRDFSVTDESGQALPFDVEEEDGFIAVLTGDDTYVHGAQTYVIKYVLSDVVLAREDATADEFMWDILDSEHLQPIAAFSADISFDQTLGKALNGNARCYAGKAESDGSCAMKLDKATGTASIAPFQVAPREGVTVAIGLAADSVVQPSVRLPNPMLDASPLVLGGAALAVGVAGATVVATDKQRRRKGRGTIVAQYDVPANLPPLVAAPIAGATANPVAAQIVHLAVNGVLRIEEEATPPGAKPNKHAQPVLRLMQPELAVDPVDRNAMFAVFGRNEPGLAITLPKNDEAFGKKMTALSAAGVQEATTRGLFEKVSSPVGKVIGRISLGLAAGLLIVTLYVLFTRNTPAAAFGVVAAIGAAMLGIYASTKHRVHTKPGAEAREYLLGVKEFIRVAEADRLTMLQSYGGAERNPDGSVNVIKLYEKLLPYAMIFGQEKQWNKVLEVKYQEQPDMYPTWYYGAAGYGFAGGMGLSSTLSSFTNSLNSAVSYTSSSSGGSTGGGFVGGGGGGGFSGGR